MKTDLTSDKNLNVQEERFGSAVILGYNELAETVCGAAARISTTNGSALEIFEKSRIAENNRSLISKVLSSGHKSLIEHFVFNLAFNNVPVLVEQFIIEFRLASYTVQSRRYVDFRNVGFFTPGSLSAEHEAGYRSHMESLFSTYEQLLDLGVPKEDARFVLPYCFKSNFYCTCNARELMHMICAMIYGRGKNCPELLHLGQSLKVQFDELLPGIIEREAGNYKADEGTPRKEISVPAPRKESYRVELISATPNAGELLKSLQKYGGESKSFSQIVRSDRPRELECFNYVFSIEHISLSAITHVARHRIQTLLMPKMRDAVLGNRYILPQSVSQNSEAQRLYEGAFERNHAALTSLLGRGLDPENLPYFALSGNTLNILVGMNARELLHFLRLRTCNRAQWEIREISISMLKLLRERESELFSLFGPSCVSAEKCPEGRMSCGRAAEMKELFAKL